VGEALSGVTPKDYAATHRSRRMREELSRSNTITEAIYEAGFNSNGRFYAHSSRTLGMTPANFRKGGAGTTIRFAVGECSLGSVLVAASDKGVCAISLGDDPDALVRDLQDQFPKAHLIGGDKTFERVVSSLPPVVVMRFFNKILERQARFAMRLVHCVALNLRGRLALTLLDLAATFGTPDRQGVRMALPITHENLAEMVGASRERVSKEMAALMAAALPRPDSVAM
jgi:hypothetical protein